MALASKTGQVRYLKAGDAGPAGPIPYPAGEYNANTKYTRTELSVPIVLDDGEYYLLNKTGTFKGIRPKDDYAANGSNATWIRMDNIKYAFIEILMANFAKLASAVFYGDYMFSQYGVDGEGNSTNAYQNFNSGTFTPNLLLDFLTGKFKSKDAEVEGKITAKEGEIGGFNIGTSSLSCSNKTASIDVEYSGGRFLHVNSGQYLAMIDVRSDDTMHAIRIQEYGSKNGINVVCNGAGLAIESYGDVRMIARQNSGEKILVNGLHLNVRNMTSGGSLYSSDDIVTFGNTSSITVFLPDASDCAGKVLYLKSVSGKAVTLSGSMMDYNSTSKMTSYQLDQYTYTLVSDGSRWIMSRSS